MTRYSAMTDTFIHDDGTSESYESFRAKIMLIGADKPVTRAIDNLNELAHFSSDPKPLADAFVRRCLCELGLADLADAWIKASGIPEPKLRDAPQSLMRKLFGRA